MIRPISSLVDNKKALKLNENYVEGFCGGILGGGPVGLRGPRPNTWWAASQPLYPYAQEYLRQGFAARSLAVGGG